MSHSSPTLAEIPHDAAPLAWERQLRPAFDVIQRGAPRAALVGTAGSGKSASLQHLRDLFRRQSREATLLHDSAAGSELEDIPSDHVLLVDDLHLLAPRQLAMLGERAEDPMAALIVASRPWPSPPTVVQITRRLEQHAPTIVLGHVSRSDVLDRLAALGLSMAEECVAHILDATRGMSWLVSAALQHHDERDCSHDGTHDELDLVLGELISHRLDNLDDDLRRAVEEVCVAAPGQAHPIVDTADGEWVMQVFSQGILLRGGDAAPLVRAAVRRAMPSQRLIELCTRYPEALEHREGLRPIHDASVADALVASADRMLATMPDRAAELYDAATECGADAEVLAARQLQAAWSAGDFDRAAALVDAAVTTTGEAPSAITLVSAAVWSARAMMNQANEVYRIAPPRGTGAAASAAIAALGVGSREQFVAPAERQSLPSALGVSMELLRTGLEASMSPDCTEDVLPDLVRSAEMYTSSHAVGAICELPAVIAAIVALNFGRPVTAQTVLEDAIAGGHGGPWARTRLLLWSAWVAVQRAHPVEANEKLNLAASVSSPLSTRDALLMHAVRVAIARRYDDAAGLDAAWLDARGTFLRADVDLYLLHPLVELVSAATRAGDAARVESHIARGLEIVSRLGEPPIWAAHVHWAGIQQGILLSSPQRLAPHAKALVAAAPVSRVAAGMARAGRVWTEVLSGRVDADAVVSAAEGLAAVGLMWDAARLAGHGAARSDDRRVASQLLACAREMHPNDGTRRLAAATDGTDGTTETAPEDVLSEREIEVARLVLQGKTYAEIGETIFISPRTAEHHIAHIRRRLGASSRSEVLARLRQLLGDGGGGATRTTEPP